MKTKKLKIGHQTYQLIQNDEGMFDSGNLGMCFKNKNRIEYTINIPNDVLADTLIHETLHAIVENYCYNIGGAGEEEIVTQLAHGLIQVMRDNPKFFDEVKALL